MRGAIVVAVLAGACAACSGHASTEATFAPGETASSAFADCAVTMPIGGWPDGVDFQRPVPWVADDSGWYGNEALWVSLPPDGLLPSLRSDEEGLLDTKFPWWRIHPGRLEVQTEEVAGRQSAAGAVPSGYGDVGFTPSGLMFIHPGCWRITGVLGAASLSFVVWVCETDDFHIGPEDRRACGAA